MVTVESMHSKEGVEFFLKIVNKWIIWITVHQHCILEQTMIHMIRNTNSFTNYKYITKWWQKQIHFRACPTFTAVYWLEHNFLPLNQATWAFLAMITLIQQASWRCFKYFFSAVNFSKKVFSLWFTSTILIHRLGFLPPIKFQTGDSFSRESHSRHFQAVSKLH